MNGAIGPDSFPGELVLAAGASANTSWQTSVFGLILLASGIPVLVHVLTHPALLRRRTRIGPAAEPEPRQRLIIGLLLPCIAAMSVVSILDRIHSWSRVPGQMMVLGDLLVASGMLLVWLVLRANQFAAATVNVESEQTVISTGPYALLRHPMYLGALLLFLGIPLGVGSWWGLIPFVAILLLIIWRLLDEETYLSAHLPGYREYCAKVTHRLIPPIW